MTSTPPPEQSGSDLTPPGLTAPGASPSYPSAPTPTPSVPGPGYGFLPGAPRPGIIPLRPLSITEIYDGAFKAYRQNFGTMFGFSLLVSLLGGVFVLWNTWKSGSITLPKNKGSEGYSLDFDALLSQSGESPVTALLGFVVAFLASIALTGVIVTVISNGTLGQRTSVGEAWAAVVPRLPALIGTTLLTLLLGVLLFAPGLVLMFSGPEGFDLKSDSLPGTVMLGLFVLLLTTIALLFLWPLVYFAPAVCVLEKMSPWASLKRGMALIKGRYWSVWFTAALAFLVVIVMQAVIVAVANGPIMASAVISGELSVGARLTDNVISLVLAALFNPFVGGVACLQYIDNRMRKEGLDVTLQQHAAEQTS